MAGKRWILFAAFLTIATSARADAVGDAEPLEVPAVPAAAATAQAPPAPMAPAGGGGGASAAARSGGAVMDLSLAEAIALAIENNLDVQVVRHDPLIAWERTRIAWGVYDPVAYVEIVRSDVETPVATFLQGAGQVTKIEDEVWANEGGLRGVVPVLSTEYLVSFYGDNVKTTQAIQSLRERWNSGLIFSVSQPLLRNLYWNAPWTEVKLSREFYGQSLEEFRGSLLGIVAEVEIAYWNLVAEEERERVAEKSLEAARKLLEQTEVQYEVGVVSRVEVTEAEAGVAEREFDLIVARNNYRNAQDVLIDRALGIELTPGTGTSINPTDRPGEYTDYAVDVEEASRKAMERRPDLAALDQQIRQQEIQVAFSRNQMAPQIDVIASYGYTGLAGKPCDPGASNAFCSGTPIDIHSNFRHSIEDFFDHDGAANWSIGGLFSIPLGNHAPRARKRQAELGLRKLESQRVRLVQDIVREIRRAARALKSAQEGIAASERRRLAAEEQFRAEGIRLEQGESTPFEVLQRERDLVAAEGQKIGSFQVYRSAVADLELQQGTILERHNVAVDEARRLR